ncbi:MAG: M48 family metalloprotease [Bacteroidota bacterium]
MKRILLYSYFLFISAFSLQSQNIELDKDLGEENAKMVESQMGLYDNKAMTAYVDALGQKLVSHLETPLFEYQFHIIPEMAPNAFALPGGYIYITTGIIPLLENEDELACIVGHEIIHSNNRHTIQQIKKSIIPRLLEVPGNLLGVINKDLGTLFNAPIHMSNSLLFASYSRKFETEADDQGILLAAAAGYDPYALPHILTRMSDAIEEATGYKEEKSYFDDHPYTPNRNSNINKHAEKLTVGPSKEVSDSFLYEFDGILFGNSPSLGVIQGNKFLQPDIDFIIEFPEDWSIDNQPTNVGAYHPDRKAAVFLSLEQSGVSPEQAGKKFMENLDEEYKSHLTDAKTYEHNGKKGYLISFTQQSDDVEMYAYVLWLPLKNKVFKLIGITPIEHRDKLEASAASLRTLTTEEKSSIKYNFVKVVEARENETIESLSKRTGNKLNLKLVAIINSHELDDKLTEGELLKIVSEKPYFDK